MEESTTSWRSRETAAEDRPSSALNQGIGGRALQWQGPVLLAFFMVAVQQCCYKPPVRGQFGEAFIELHEGYKAKKQHPYENHGQKHENLGRIIERNLREFGWPEGCMTSQWCCAPFIVPKGPPADQNSIDGWRMVVDFGNLNAETKADSQPLALFEEEIANRASCRLFSVLDLCHCFHQMPLRKDSRPLTSMWTPSGPVQLTVMPMGLKNTLSLLQRMMQDVLFTAHPELSAFLIV